MRKHETMMVVAVASLTLATTQARANVPEEKGETTALALTLGGTAASAGLILAGASMRGEPRIGFIAIGAVTGAFMPSIGHVYGHGKARSTGLTLRLAGVAVVGLGLLIGDGGGGGDTCDTWMPEGCRTWSSPSFGAADGTREWVMGFCVATIAVGALIDVITVRYKTRAHTARLSGTRVQLAPATVSSPTGVAPGVQLTGSF